LTNFREKANKNTHHLTLQNHTQVILWQLFKISFTVFEFTLRFPNKSQKIWKSIGSSNLTKHTVKVYNLFRSCTQSHGMVEFPLISLLHVVRDCPILHIKNYIMVMLPSTWTKSIRYHNTSSVTEMLQTLNWPTLEKRRIRTRIILPYKIIHRSFSDNFSKYRVLSIWKENLSRTFHLLQFV
jgi:hypothetical protein